MRSTQQNQVPSKKIPPEFLAQIIAWNQSVTDLPRFIWNFSRPLSRPDRIDPPLHATNYLYLTTVFKQIIQSQLKMLAIRKNLNVDSNLHLSTVLNGIFRDDHRKPVSWWVYEQMRTNNEHFCVTRFMPRALNTAQQAVKRPQLDMFDVWDVGHVVGYPSFKCYVMHIER